MENNKPIGELEFIEISNDSASANIALQGAHVFHFQAKGKKPLIWLSDTSQFNQGKPIRGGIPICWPWFGSHNANSTLPNHGFARTALWKHTETKHISNSQTKITLCLVDSPSSFEIWPHRFELLLEIYIGPELKISLTTINRDSQAFDITCALHSYLFIDDVTQAHIKGLDSKPYYDKVDNKQKTQHGSPDFKSEIDRVYQQITTPLLVSSPDRCLKIETNGSQTVVVWNPGEILAAKMPDLSDYRTMLCVESAAVLNDAMKIQAGESQTLSTILSYEGK